MKKTSVEIAHMLIDKLREDYLDRVSWARIYEQLVNSKGGRVVTDHVAFRTLNTHTGEQPEGIEALGHIFRALGYKPAGEYHFAHTSLYAHHLEHADKTLPRLFISQLEVDQLPMWAQQIIHETVKDTLYLIPDAGIELMNRIQETGHLNSEAAEILVSDLAGYFRRPWAPPSRETVLRINDVSQYGAWVLLHGNSVNHFAADVGRQNVPQWPDLESTCQALEQSGVPMKNSIEGERGSKLRQSSTLAVKEEVDVKGEDGADKILWTYAYYEFTERGSEERNGHQVPFSGFLGQQASHLFEMTKTLDN